MLKKFAVTIAAIFVLALVSTSVFAQMASVPLTQADIDAIVVVYADPAPAAVSQAIAAQGDVARFTAVNAKVLFIYQMKKTGVDDATLKTTSASSGMPVDDNDLKVYADNAEKVTPVLDAFVAANTPQ